MKENRIEYNDVLDELHIIFNDDVDVPIVHKLDNNVVIEFDNDNDISAIVFPNFAAMLGRPIFPNEVFTISKTSFEDNFVEITLMWSGPPINLRLSLV